MAEMTIGGAWFRSKAEAGRMVRRILNETPLGDRLRGESARFILALLARHPKVEDKIGPGVESIRVDLAPVYRTRQFQIERVDGSCVDFSYVVCLHGKEWSQEQQVRWACRAAVREQVQGYRDEALAAAGGYGVARCAVSGLLLEQGEMHIDHESPWTFDALLAGWLEASGLGWSDVGLCEPADGIGIALEEPYRSAWRTHHGACARLRLVTAQANLSDLRKEATT